MGMAVHQGASNRKIDQRGDTGVRCCRETGADYGASGHVRHTEGCVYRSPERRGDGRSVVLARCQTAGERAYEVQLRRAGSGVAAIPARLKPWLQRTLLG